MKPFGPLGVSKVVRIMTRIKTTSHRRRRFGGSTIEYMLVLALIVIPLFLMVNSIVLHMWFQPTPDNNKTMMIPFYEHRIETVISWPVG
jgi:hypothetical protein